MEATTDRMLEKVRKLIAKAEGTDSTQEAEVYLEKAQELMLQHSISEAMLNASRPAEKRTKAEALEFFSIADYGTLIRYQLVSLASEVAGHFGCNIVFFGLRRGGARSNVSTTVVGMPSDLRSFQTLYTALMLDLVSRLQPRPDVSKSFAENVYILHDMGVKWREIANLMNKAFVDHRPEGWREAVRIGKDGNSDILVPWNGSSMDGGRLIRAYRKHCAEIGEKPRAIQSPVMFQRNFAVGYVERISVRLAIARMKGQTQEAGTALALRSDGIEQLFAGMFPKLGKAVPQKDIGYDPKARYAGHEAGDRADIGADRFGHSQRPELS